MLLNLLQSMREELQRVGSKYPSLATFKTIDGSTNQNVPFEIELNNPTDDDSAYKTHVLLIGALNGDEPVGAEMLMRLVRHTVKGTAAFFITPIMISSRAVVTSRATQEC